ncbi:DUF6279 family lipoprotein [Variovorax arabinosiphilus]|uniref:DUF6279 family lipoprotein n=1 Tax=Variovorax arabinosiphilus TaxID=3053498 RepID=UPI002574FAB1|nr:MULTISPECIES: DUF6279 family lipoprotein [unclassified Variovorax]MDM0119340.1 DUF6279 family lipoprotein [Variovorax sp. J2L1-78]MDM0129766.1 DUF6279 family lipoprotein [Variovorax sp. J2L1-63]MDM0232448.1 DUF6279 family lipoprotein [Variovorax sp. J2R1-6]
MRLPITCAATLAKFGCAVALGALLLGCSAVKLAYNNLPEFGYWWLDSYVDFNGAQSPRVKEQLAQLLERHRRTELPKLLALVERAERLAVADVTAAQVCAASDELRDSLLATAVDVAGPGAELALGLGDAQLQHIEVKYAKNNAEYASDWLERSVEGQHRKRYDTFLERSEDFYGTLDDAQRALLRQMADRSIFDPRRVDAERRQRQRESLALLRRFANSAARPPEVQAALVAYARRIADPPPGPWRDHQQALLQESCNNIARLHNATRPAQREQAVRRLQAYAQDIRDLIAAH